MPAMGALFIHLNLMDCSEVKNNGHTTGITRLPILGDQTIQICGQFDGFPIKKCIVWVGVI